MLGLLLRSNSDASPNQTCLGIIELYINVFFFVRGTIFRVSLLISSLRSTTSSVWRGAVRGEILGLAQRCQNCRAAPRSPSPRLLHPGHYLPMPMFFQRAATTGDLSRCDYGSNWIALSQKTVR